MTEAAIKAAVDAFLRHVTYTARREIEKAVRATAADGKLAGKDSINAAMTLSSEPLALNVTIYSKIDCA